MPNLNEKAIIAKKSCKAWGAKSTDHELTAEVHAARGMAEDAGIYRKNLVAEEHFKNIKAAYRRWTKEHERLTIPWDGRKVGLLNTKLFYDYDGFYVNVCEDVKQYVISDLVIVWPQILEESENRLGNRFNLNDFPAVTDLQDRFKINVEYYPVPSADVSCLKDLLGKDITRIGEMELQRQQAKLQEGMADVWQRLYKSVRRMSETLKEPDKKFQKTMINNVIDLNRLLPSLNLAEDPKLTSLQKRVEEELSVFSADDLRGSEKARELTSAVAAEIVTEIEEAQPQLRSIEF